MKLHSILLVFKKAAVNWSEDRAPTHGAALAFYTTFSLAPLLLIAISIASLVVGEDAARSGIVAEISRTLGPVSADVVTSVLANANESGGNAVVTIIGLLTLLFGASGVFGELQDALNVIWKPPLKARTGNALIRLLKHRLLSFAAVVGTGFLLLVSLVISALLAALSQWLTNFPGGALLWHVVGVLVSFGFISLLFTLIFKLLPDMPVLWSNAWIGGVLTAALFLLGQQLIGLYLGQAGIGSAHGAAGSLVVLLVWVYYSAQIVLFGAEFTHACEQIRGSKGTQHRAISPERGREFASVR